MVPARYNIYEGEAGTRGLSVSHPDKVYPFFFRLICDYGVCSLEVGVRIGTLDCKTQTGLQDKKPLIAVWTEYCYRSTRSWLPLPRGRYVSNQLVKTGMSIATGWRQSGQDSFAVAMIALPQSRQAQ